MKLLSALFVACALLAAPVLVSPASAQQAEEACEAGDLNLAAADGEASAADAPDDVPAYGAVAVTSNTPALDVAPQTPAEKAVQDVIRRDGVHVVHFWAPWCPNAKNELADGWGDLVRDNPNVSFTFVSIWNDGKPGTDVLQSYDLPNRVTTLQQPDVGASDVDENRRRMFLGLPVPWSPSTLIFHENGELAFSMNYGEMKMSTIQTLIDATRADW